MKKTVMVVDDETKILEANLKKKDFSVGKAFSTCSLGCIEGCYHGVMESLISHDDDKEVTIGKIYQIFATPYPTTRYFSDNASTV